LTFNPEPGFTGDPTVITYILTETLTGLTDTATVTLGYDQAAPTASNDTSNDNTPGTAVTQNILTNDELADGTTATVSTASVVLIDPVTGLPSVTPNEVIVSGQGVWNYNTLTGDLTFTPETGYIGSPDPIDYELTDISSGLTDQAKVTVIYAICPVITAGSDVTVCTGNLPFTPTGASVTNGVTILWTTDGTGTFNDATIANAVYNPSLSDIEDVQVTLTMTVTGNTGCVIQSDVMILTLWQSATAFAGNDHTV
jgi:CshA-type fibril repeat protein